MNIEIRAYEDKYAADAARIWNRVITDGVAFPREEPYDADEAHEFFLSQDFTGVAVDAATDSPLGVYILHPNFVGRCGHICNTSYAVSVDTRGHGVGEALVRHSAQKAKELGYRTIQLNAVVSFNHAALVLYKKVGFVAMTPIPDGFRLADGTYTDIIPHYLML